MWGHRKNTFSTHLGHSKRGAKGPLLLYIKRCPNIQKWGRYLLQFVRRIFNMMISYNILLSKNNYYPRTKIRKLFYLYGLPDISYMVVFSIEAKKKLRRHKCCLLYHHEKSLVRVNWRRNLFAWLLNLGFFFISSLDVWASLSWRC